MWPLMVDLNEGQMPNAKMLVLFGVKEECCLEHVLNTSIARCQFPMFSEEKVQPKANRGYSSGGYSSGNTRGYSPLDSPDDRATKRRMSEEHAEDRFAKCIVVKLDQELVERFKYQVPEINTLKVL